MDDDDSVNAAFPEDIITEILYRLPSESVGRFRCVSKGWLSLLTQPEFIKTHHRKNRRKHHMYVEVERSRARYVLYSHPPISDDDHPPSYHIIHPTDKLPFKFNGDATMVFRGSCEGLVLVSQRMDMHSYETLTIINPTTRESVQLPHCGCNPPPRNGGTYLRFITHGFGYDSVTDDYKVVTLAFFGCQYQNTDLVTQAFVYSLTSNTWRQLFIGSPYDIRDWSDAVYLDDGFLLWKGRSKDFSHIIVAFSLVDESFSQVPVPYLSHVTKTLLTYCRLVVLAGKLAMYMFSRYFKFEIWLMNEYGDKESWTKIPLDGMFDDDEFPERDYRVFDDDDDGKMWVVNNGQLRIYDFEKTTFIKNVYWKSSRFYLFATYVENLLSLKRKDTTTTHAQQILHISPERQNSEVALPKNLNPIYHHPFCNKFLRLAKVLNDKRASLRKKRKKRKAEEKDKRKKVQNIKKKPILVAGEADLTNDDVSLGDSPGNEESG